MLYSNITTESVLAAAQAHLADNQLTTPHGLIEAASVLAENLFAGRHPDYQQADLSYHDFEHTLLATQCYIDLAAGRINHGAQPAFNGRQFSLGYVAIILHDCGYLKKRDDLAGTGAKYTNTHVQRSCALAGRFLPELGCSAAEIEGIQNAILCTGITSQIELLTFQNAEERLTGCMVATADYLGQMADPGYPGKLASLFAEFEESNDFTQVPPEKRLFKSAQDLMAKTRGFWNYFALPKLEKDYEGVYRVLVQADGSNLYVDAVNANLRQIDALQAH